MVTGSVTTEENGDDTMLEYQSGRDVALPLVADAEIEVMYVSDISVRVEDSSAGEVVLSEDVAEYWLSSVDAEIDDSSSDVPEGLLVMSVGSLVDVRGVSLERSDVSGASLETSDVSGTSLDTSEVTGTSLDTSEVIGSSLDTSEVNGISELEDSTMEEEAAVGVTT